jgi:hypothetical protein
MLVAAERDRMRRLAIAVACIALCALWCISGGPGTLVATAEEQPLVVVRGPTVVAFFKPVTDAEMEKDADTNETLADFQLYASRVREPLGKAGIEFQELYARAFRVRDGGETTTFRPAKVYVGYYFVAPGRKPRIEYGVMTDDGLLQAAHEYFGSSAK